MNVQTDAASMTIDLTSMIMRADRKLIDHNQRNLTGPDIHRSSANSLRVPVDIFVIRKLGVPRCDELAMVAQQEPAQHRSSKISGSRLPSSAYLVDVIQKISRILVDANSPGLPQFVRTVAAAEQPDAQRPAARGR